MALTKEDKAKLRTSAALLTDFAATGLSEGYWMGATGAKRLTDQAELTLDTARAYLESLAAGALADATSNQEGALFAAQSAARSAVDDAQAGLRNVSSDLGGRAHGLISVVADSYEPSALAIEAAGRRSVESLQALLDMSPAKVVDIQEGIEAERMKRLQFKLEELKVG